MTPSPILHLPVLIAAFSAFAIGPKSSWAQTPSEWKADIAYMMSAISSVHPAPFHRIAESEFREAAARLSRNVERLTPQQIAMGMQAIVAMLHDGHSRLDLGEPVFKRAKFFGVRIDRLGDGIFITNASTEFENLIGAKVMRIAALPAAVAWDSVMRFASGDNVFSRMSGVPLLLTMPEVLSGIGISAPDSLALTITSGATTRRVSVPSRAGQFRPRWSTSRLEKGLSSGQREALPVALSELHREQCYWFTQRGPVVFAQVNQIQNCGDTVDIGPTRGVISLPSFGSRLANFTDSVGASRLIIDIRYNGGGNNELAKPFVSSIVEHPNINKRGRLFVVTGRETYSAAMNLTSMLEDRTAAIFVGEPPGGAPRHYGDATRFVLPNSKLGLRISTLRWDTGVRPTDVREIMEPGLPVAPRFADARAGVDAAFERIINYTAGGVLADRLRAKYESKGLDSAFSLYDREKQATPVAAPWRSDVQQLLEFAGAVIPIAKSRDEVFKAFSAVTERYPESHEAWLRRARVHSFISDWPNVLASLARARKLRPENEFIKRSYEAAKLR